MHEPSFRLVLIDSKNSSKSGRFQEILGSYDPRKSRDSLDVERIKHWLSLGANPTPTVHNLLVKHKVIDAKKIHVAAKSKHAPTEASEKVPTAKENVIVEEAPEPASVQDSGETKEETV